MSSTPPDYALEAEGLQKTYAGSKSSSPKHALKGVDLKVKRGSIFGLLGPNGAGKSTFINIFAGLVNKSSGTGRIWGIDIDRQPRQARAAIGIVPQEINMDVFFTPFETLELMAGFYGVPKSERRTDEILEAVGLADKRDAYVRMLSGGMKRRLLVAKALVHNPPVLVLDEPTAGVDIELRRQLWEYVVELNKAGTTIVLTTHYLEEAQELCDEIAIINEGEVVACEPKDQLLRRLDRKTLVIEPVNALSEVPEVFARLPHTEVSMRGGAIAITYKFGEVSVADLIERFRETGNRINDLRTEEPDLEDVFLSLTYNRAKPDTAA
ncbi:ABC transporter ATP-binding protein [Marinicauda pacifica]|jgi:ABC-2 type transport system ATP-binding protein|uniref:ABC transporter ATP-binding protein n=1 Tax=Marinicauda pacifica TaxID=1133559 RepID=A0A4S2HBD4_9PROT|nr:MULTISPECIES: ABC transporter ATP-binding protein [Marinicauda]TGY93206.1 ABC transporter ATP-binding protein [Marinicauda pacifica]GGE43746.1 ABC transporter ATP-binding protein [Marinicauda pacifica]